MSASSRRSRTQDGEAAEPTAASSGPGPLIEPTTRYAVSVVAALMIAGSVLLDAARGRADVTTACVRFLVAFAFVDIALRLVAGIADGYRGAGAAEAAPAREDQAEHPRRRASDQPPSDP